VIKPGGYFIVTGHNIKSLHFSPYFFKERKIWYLKNCLHAFKSKEYIIDLGMYTFYCSPEYFVKQMEEHGFSIRETVGLRQSHHNLFNKYISPYNHYVFQKK
jgi:hypothetical protein